MTTTAAGRASPDRALDVLLAGYASGTLSAPLHALVAGHLTLNPASRAFVTALETAGGVVVERTPPLPIADREGKLATIFSVPAQPGPRSASPPGDRTLPEPIVRYIGRSFDEVPWRPLLPGVRHFKVEATEGGEASLYCMKPGRSMPVHTHDGAEYMLVLRGGLSDAHGHYGRGDIAIADETVEHRPVTDKHEDCVCFSVTDAPLRLTGPIGRLVQRFFGR